MRNDLETGNDTPDLEAGLSKVTTYLLAISGPLLLILIGGLLPLHFAMEELWKLAIVIRMTKSLESKMNVYHAMSVGLLFGLTEWVLYVMNAFTAMDATPLIFRLVMTVPMHAITALIMFVIGRRGGWRWVIALTAAVAVHGTFNYFVN